jgi:hypothetical protein
MRLGINLRGDLAKLDDIEIAAKYEALISEMEAKIRQAPGYALGKLPYRTAKLLLSRGPFHAPIFYKLQVFLFGLFGYLTTLNGETLPTARGYEFYLLECELRDVRDEIKRRLAKRKSIPAT